MSGKELAEILLRHPDEEVILRTDKDFGFRCFEVAGYDPCATPKLDSGLKAVCISIFESDVK